FACLAGVLLVPDLGLDATILTLLVVQAFGAAAVGFFSSLPLTYLGGLLVGIAASVAQKYSSTTTPNALLNGLQPSVPFLVLFLLLIAPPRRRLTDRRLSARAGVRHAWHAPAGIQVGGSVVALGVLIAVPYLVDGARMPTYTDALTKVLLFLSL